MTATAIAAAGSSVARNFRPVLYKGTSNKQNISVGFKPDLIWLKVRNGSSHHQLFDSSRGQNLFLHSSANDMEGFSNNKIASITANGFFLGDNQHVNQAGRNYLAWCFKKQQALFDIVSYKGIRHSQVIKHQLGVQPSLMIIKERSGANPWVIYHEDVSSTPWQHYLRLNSSRYLHDDVLWGNYPPTSDDFSVGLDHRTNRDGSNYIAYLFASKKGELDIGGYLGNGVTSGPNIVTGFPPSFIIIKNSTNTGNWLMIDNLRPGKVIFANNSNDETVGNYLTFNSNGFQINSSHRDVNSFGDRYIYMAFR